MRNLYVLNISHWCIDTLVHWYIGTLSKVWFRHYHQDQNKSVKQKRNGGYPHHNAGDFRVTVCVQVISDAKPGTHAQCYQGQRPIVGILLYIILKNKIEGDQYADAVGYERNEERSFDQCEMF